MIEVHNLTKTYGARRAIDNLSFTIKPGAIYGFLGPNGAGKSTTMNIITGCLAASSGSVSICGHDIFAEPLEAKKHIGYLPEVPPVYVDMTPREYLSFVARAKGVRRREIPGQVNQAIEAMKIQNYANQLIAHLSKGYRQRVGIAQAILGEPEIIILDEPTVGLDPQQIVDIRNLIVELGQRHTIVLSSHILPEIREVCQSVLILAKGKLVAFDTLENLETRFSGGMTVEILACGSKERLRALLDGLDFIREYKFALSESEDSGLSRVLIRDHKDIRAPLFYAFADADIPIMEMKAKRMNLEQVYLQLTSETAATPPVSGD